MWLRDLTGGTGTREDLAEKESWNWLKDRDRTIAAEGIAEGFRSAESERVVPEGGEQRQNASDRHSAIDHPCTFLSIVCKV
jgi:hypothetical protein